MLKRFFNDMKKHWAYVVYATKSQLKSEVASSKLNWVWWILEPICLMLIYAFIFGVVLDARAPYFTAFIFVGLTLWNFFNNTLSKSVKIVKSNKSIVSKVYLPKYILILQRMGVNAFKMMVNMIIVIGLMVFYQVPVSWNILFILPVFAVLFLLTFGVSCIVLHFGVFIEDLANVVRILMRLGFYISGIMFSILDRIPGVLGDVLAKANPMAFLIISARDSLLYGITPDGVWLAVWGAVGLLLSVIGVRLIYKNENGYIKVI